MAEPALKQDGHAPELAGNRQFLTFTLSGETYGADILDIKEIIEYGRITPVPMMPDFIAGVINLRGAVVPVVNLARRFGGASTELSKRTSIVIVELTNDSGSNEVGIIVDTVNEVLEIEAGNIEPAPAFGTRVRADFIAGMGKVDSRFLVLLNVDHVLSIEELSKVDAARTLVNRNDGALQADGPAADGVDLSA